jgi:hypothetical protein
VFLVNLPVVAIALLAGRLLVPTSSDPAPRRLDPAGTVMSFVGLAGVLYGIIEAPSQGWTHDPVVAAFTVGMAVLAAFVAWELHSDHPMLNMRLFENPRFSGASIAIMLVFSARPLPAPTLRWVTAPRPRSDRCPNGGRGRDERCRAATTDMLTGLRSASCRAAQATARRPRGAVTPHATNGSWSSPRGTCEQKWSRACAPRLGLDAITREIRRVSVSKLVARRRTEGGAAFEPPLLPDPDPTGDCAARP